mmetsp:Transcript_16872/g.42560  ORF Transcript_16872/g.42560 Transcript_16872/m.42560 type:complete len:279 (+) Transcript_16872:55-891(+)
MKTAPWMLVAWWAVCSMPSGEPRRTRRRLNVTGNPTCASEGCAKKPVFGNPLDKIACRCSRHKLLGHENLYAFECEQDGCNKSAYFGSLEDGVRRACRDHREFGQANLMSKSCIDPTGCIKRACYGSDVDRKPLFCAKHKDENHVEVVNRRCSVSGCDRRSTYGDPVSRKAVFCALHKRPGLANVSCQTCRKCKRRPLFGSPIDRRVLFCRAHKREGDEDLRSLRCWHTGCLRQPSFGEKGKRGVEGLVFCAQHRKEEHVNTRFWSQSSGGESPRDRD